MTRIVAETLSDTATVKWSTVVLAGLLTWTSVSGVPWVLVVLGSVLPIAEVLFETDIPVISSILSYCIVMVFVLMFSAFVSWAPLLLMLPVVKWLADNGHQSIFVGVVLGAISGAATGAMALGTGYAPLGAIVGAVFGSVNLLLLRVLMSKTVKTAPHN